MEVAWDGGVMIPRGEPLIAPSSGVHWLAVSHRDATQNASEPNWFRIGIDATPPTVVIHLSTRPVIDSQEVSWIPAGVTARLEATDAESGVADAVLECEGCGGKRLDTQTFDLGDSGSVSLTGWAEDRVEHRQSCTPIKLSIDGQAPTGRILIDGIFFDTGETIFVSSDGVIRVEQEDRESGIASGRFIRDGSEVNQARWSAPAPEGPHEVSFSVTDLVGNQATIGPMRFTTDTKPPEIQWEWIVSPDSVTQSAAEGKTAIATLSVSAHDDGSGLEALVWTVEGMVPFGGRRWILVQGDFRVHAASLDFKATDRLGHVSTTRVPISGSGRPMPIRVRLADAHATTSLQTDSAMTRKTAQSDLSSVFGHLEFPRIIRRSPQVFDPVPKIRECPDSQSARLDASADLTRLRARPEREVTR